MICWFSICELDQQTITVVWVIGLIVVGTAAAQWCSRILKHCDCVVSTGAARNMTTEAPNY